MRASLHGAATSVDPADVADRARTRTADVPAPTMEGCASRDHLPAGAARQRSAGRDRARHPRPPGRDRRRRDRLGQDHAAAEDLPRARPRVASRTPSRAASPRARSPSASPRSCRCRARRRLVGYKVRFTDKVQRRHPHQAHDRRHPAQRDPPRPRAAPLRHDHHRRGARALPQRRLPARLPEAAAAPTPRPQGHRHERDDRPRELREALRGCRRRSPRPIIEVSGRTYPVEIRYRPLVADRDGGADEDSDDERATADDDDVEGIIDALDELDREAPGDVLVFLSGESEIRDADGCRARHVREAMPRRPRCSRSTAGSARPSSTGCSSRRSVAGVRRRVVLATNVAETSLTVPGIRYVDRRRHRAHQSATACASKVQQLPIEAISQASAQPALGARRAHERRHRDPPLLARRTSSAGPSSPTPRSCARTSPPSSCR